jgi:hypothetical protein
MQTPEHFEHLLQDFFDHSLDAESTDALFAELARNADLQESLRAQMLLRSAGNRAQQHYAPPQASTDAIFAKLGLGQAAVVAAPAASSLTSVAATSSPVVGFVMPFWGYIAGSLASAICASVLTIWWFSSSGGFPASGFASSEQGLFSSSTLSREVARNPPFSSGGGQEFAFATAHQSQYDTVRERVIIREIIHEPLSGHGQQSGQLSLAQLFGQGQNVFPLGENTNDANPAATTNLSNVVQNIPSGYVATQEFSHAPSGTEPQEKQNDSQHFASTSQPSSMSNNRNDDEHKQIEQQHLIGIQAEVRGLLGTSLPRTELPSGSSSPFKNSAASIRYAIDPHHSVGIEFGAEEYFQQYLNVVEGSLYRVSQNPLLTWAGIAYRFNALPESPFSPFGQITLGGTRMGGLGRLMFGLTYAPESRVRFMLGAEGSALLYNHQNLWNASPKVGITYGVSITF